MANRQALVASRATPPPGRCKPLTPELWQRIESILDDLLELPAPERQPAVEKACGEDRELRRQVELYLGEADDAEDFMETPAVSLRAATPGAWSPGDVRGQPDEPGQGQRIGPYRVERLIGRGGMGAVYLATRVDEFEMRRVALKLLKRGLSTGELARRFQHERQILAQLDHPNIAKLLDGGTTADGLPYFVMDYVEGQPIDSYCHQHDLGIRQRLQLFRRVCSAVHRAHQNLVVHRDLKPANILVGADGEPKLLDFGIAKPLDVDGSATTALTASSAQPMTLAYASPEQIDNRTVTTASDVYSLGVVLYQLLTRRRPYRPASDKPLDLALAIRQQRPEKPSTAVTRAATDLPAGDEPLTQTPDSLRSRRIASLRHDRRRLAGDLDSIVLTALAKDPDHRYPSVEQLSADLERHLEGLPVTTRKPTFAYVAGKFVRRHTWETALAVIVLTAIVGFSIVTDRLRDQAIVERERAEEASDFLVELFQATGPDDPEITASELLDRGKKQFMEYRGSQPRLYARLAFTMAEIYYRHGHYGDAQALLEDGLSDLRRHLDHADDPLLADATNDLAAVFWAQGLLPEAEGQLRESLAMTIRMYSEESTEAIDTLNNLATLAKERGDFEAAQNLYIRVLALLAKVTPPIPEQVARSHLLLGTLLLDLGGFEAAETQLRQALDMRRQLHGAEDTRVAIVHNNLGIALQAQGKAAESEQSYRQALKIRRKLLGSSHPRVAATEAHLASLLVSAQKLQEAELLARQALETLGDSTPGHWRIAHAQGVLGSVLVARDLPRDAEPLLLESYQTLIAAKGECDRYILDALRRMIDVHDASGQGTQVDVYRSRLNQCTAKQADGQPVIE